MQLSLPHPREVLARHRRRFGSMRWKLMLPYAGLTVLFALVAGYGFTKMLTSSIEDRLHGQLSEAGAVAADLTVRDERQHLTTVRSISLTDGVAEAVARGDSEELARVAQPLVANAKAERVEVLDKTGQRLFGTELQDSKTLHYQPLTDSPRFLDWAIVANVLAGKKDNGGDKWSQLVETGSGFVLYTAGPITATDGQLVGVVLAGNLLSSYLPAVKAASGADVAVFDIRGALLGSTFGLGPDERQVLRPTAPLVATRDGSDRREVGGRGYQFLYSDLRLRGQVAARIAIALPTDSLAAAGNRALWQTSLVFGLLAIAVMAVGWALARGLTKPLHRLVGTALAVAGGDLSARTELTGRDEIAMVAATFDAMAERLHRQHIATIGALASAIDARDPYTAGHSVRVGELSVVLGRELGLPSSSIFQLRVGGILHDIGKIGIRDDVLLKPGALTAEERRMIEEHPRIGVNILAGADLPPEILAIVGNHHERLNGKGYPSKLTADELSIFPRVVAVGDVYDALTTDRPYRAGMTIEEALRILRKEAMEGMVDPEVVNAMARVAKAWDDHVRTADGDFTRIRELLSRRAS